MSVRSEPTEVIVSERGRGLSGVPPRSTEERLARGARVGSRSDFNGCIVCLRAIFSALAAVARSSNAF